MLKNNPCSIMQLSSLCSDSDNSRGTLVIISVSAVFLFLYDSWNLTILIKHPKFYNRISSVRHMCNGFLEI